MEAFSKLRLQTSLPITFGLSSMFVHVIYAVSHIAIGEDFRTRKCGACGVCDTSLCEFAAALQLLLSQVASIHAPWPLWHESRLLVDQTTWQYSIPPPLSSPLVVSILTSSSDCKVPQDSVFLEDGYQHRHVSSSSTVV
jgi:hypothetical protein